MLGSYRLVERLGTGGMGVVYRAVHEKLGRAVAIKVLNRVMLSDRTNVARFFQEARTVNTFRHPNVVDVYDFVTAGKDIYMVMEFLVGHDLHHAIHMDGSRPFSPERAIRIVEQMCGALQAAHDRAIIHRDLKPANVYITQQAAQEDFVKLLDFGLAKLERTEGRMTRDGIVLGTPEYMAPEQARGDALDHRVDLYAVGCIAYHMLTGCQLFVGGSYAEVMVRHVREPPPPPRSLNPEIPETLETALLRTLAKRAEDRPDSARELAEEFALAIGQPFDTTGAFVGSGLTSGQRSSVTATTFAAVSRTLHLERPARKAFALVGLAVAAGAVGLGVWMRPHIAGSASQAVVAQSQSGAPSTGPGMKRIVRLLLQSHPPGAAVIDDKGKNLGRTPQDLVVQLGSEHQLDFVLDGYHRSRRAFRADVDTTIAVALEPIPGRGAPPMTPQVESPSERRKRPARTPGTPANPGGASPDLDSRARTINPFGR